MFRANAGSTSFEWVNSANTAVNMTLTQNAGLSARSTITAGAGAVINGGWLTVNNQLMMTGANQIGLSGGSYTGYLRGDNSGLVGFINQAGNAWNMQLYDSGIMWLRDQYRWGDQSNILGQYNGSGSVGGHTEAAALVQCSNNVNLRQVTLARAVRLHGLAWQAMALALSHVALPPPHTTRLQTIG